MDNGIYIALSRQMGLFRNMEAVANNIANADTGGYQAEKMMFDDFLVKGGEGPKMAFTNDVSTYHDTRNGPVKVTGNPLDVAISGPGYFAVQTPLGERYTRAGSFHIDANGTLVNVDGNPVLDDGGQPIVFEQEDQNVVIGELGNIKVDGEERANLQVVEFDNPQMLERINSTMFKADIAPQPAAQSRVLNGVLEGSNVEAVKELTRMIEVNRAVGSTQKLIDAQYDMIRKTANTWAKND